MSAARPPEGARTAAHRGEGIPVSKPGLHLHRCDLPVPVQVDEERVAWSVDGVPVLLVPRRLWVTIQKAVEEGLGMERARALFRDTGQRTAHAWCQQQGEHFGLTGAALFEHYMRSASRRGYGRLIPEWIDMPGGVARVRVEQSVYAAEFGPAAGRKVCHLFEGSFAGGLQAASERAGQPGAWSAQETQCAAEGVPHCLFEMRRERP